MHKYKRAITLGLALLMIASVFFSLFSSFAYAAELILEVDTISSTANVAGTPDTGTFGAAGKYNFEVIQASNSTDLALKLVDTVSGSNIPVGDIDNTKTPFSFTDGTNLKDTISMGGLTIKKNISASWAVADKFTVVIRRKISSKEPMVSYNKVTSYRSWDGIDPDPNLKGRNNSALYEVTRNKEVNIHLTVADPTGGELKDFFAIVEGSAFKTVSESEISDNRFTTRVYDNPIDLQNGRKGYEIDIVRLRYSGKGNSVAITYGYKVDGQPVEYSANITIPECVEYVRRPDSSEPDPDETDPIVPHIIVSEYSYGSKQIVAGQEFPLSITMTNTSPNLDLENIIMKVTTSAGSETTSGGGGLSITSASNTYYIPTLNKKASVTKDINIRAMPNAKPQSHDITIEFSFQYVSNDKRQTSDKDREVISIPVTQVDRFTVNPIEAPAYLYVGEEFPLSAVFVNKGRSDVYNVSAEIRGIQNSGQKQFIGNVESGKENSADFLISASEPGEMKGEVIITYEDANMNTKEVIMPFSAMIQGMTFEPPIDPNPMPMEPEVPASTEPDSKTISLGFAAVIIAALTAFVNVKKVKAKRMGDEDEDL